MSISPDHLRQTRQYSQAAKSVLETPAGADEATLKIRFPLDCAADHVDRFLQSSDTALAALHAV